MRKYILQILMLIILITSLIEVTNQNNKIFTDFKFEYDDYKITAIYSIEDEEYVAKDIIKTYIENDKRIFIITKDEYIIIKLNINEIVRVDDINKFEISDKYAFENMIEKEINYIEEQKKLDNIYVILLPLLVIIVPLLVLSKFK